MSLQDPIQGVLFPTKLSDGTLASFGIGFERGNPDEGRAGFFIFLGQPTIAEGSVYFADVTTWQDCIDFVERLKTDLHHSEDAAFEGLKDRIRKHAGE
jgi:hypothetical protein